MRSSRLTHGSAKILLSGDVDSGRHGLRNGGKMGKKCSISREVSIEAEVSRLSPGERTVHSGPNLT